jgi:hypothetical protein
MVKDANGVGLRQGLMPPFMMAERTVFWRIRRESRGGRFGIGF